MLPQVVPEGVTVLVGAGKIGKSWWGLELALSITTGRKAFGHWEVEQGAVLYLALEDRPRRLQARLEELGLAGLSAAPDALFFKTSLATIKGGGLDWLDGWLAKHAVRLVIIDVLAKVKDQKGRNDDSFLADYQVISAIKALADKHDTSILIAHHPRKADASDVFDRISGTTGIVAAADALLFLERPGRAEQAKLTVTGRDVDDQALAFSFSAGKWTYEGPATSSRLSGNLERLISMLRAAGKPLTPSEIFSLFPEDDRPPESTLKSRLKSLVGLGELLSDHGRYRVPKFTGLIEEVESTSSHSSDWSGSTQSSRSFARSRGQ